MYLRADNGVEEEVAGAVAATVERYGRLTTLVARARSAVTGSTVAAWRDLGRFFTVIYPAALYRAARWWR